MTVIKTDRGTYIDTMDKIHKTEEGIMCCGPLKLLKHIEEKEFNRTTYRCKCGNQLCVEIKMNRGKNWKRREYGKET